MKFETFARLQKRARHPAWRQAQQAARRTQFRFDQAGHVFLDRLKFSDRCEGHKIEFESEKSRNRPVSQTRTASCRLKTEPPDNIFAAHLAAACGRSGPCRKSSACPQPRSSPLAPTARPPEVCRKIRAGKSPLAAKLP